MLEKDDRIGDYKLEKFLGRGQFGEVWLAEKQLQVSTRKVRHALKFLFSAGDEIDLKAAEAEVDTWIEAGGHPNVMSVLDMLTHKGHIIIVSEFAAGGSLKSWLAQNGGKAPTEEKALEMMRGILRGIEHLHSKSVVHRDLKPDNILLQGDFPRITDFGISRIVDESTMSTKAVGSPAYMSPESFNGSKSPQTDIWSAGVLFYEMLSGDYPFSHDTIYGLVNTILEDEPQPLPATVSPELRKIVETALQKDREKRFQTAREMLTAVERAGYDLQAKAERDKEWKKTLPMGEKKDSPPKQSAIETLPLKKEPSKTQPSQTQPAKAEKTDDKEIEQTKDWRELERQRIEREQNDLRKIGRKLEQNRGEKKSKTALWVVIGSVLGMTLFGGLFWAMSGGGAAVLNKTTANSAQTVTTTTPAKTSDAPTGIEMVKIPAGSFMMGSDNSDSDEKPVHRVNISKSFYMGMYEVTQAQWKAVMGNNPSGFSSCGGDCPVEKVSWVEVQSFIAKLNNLQSDYQYRLPTEAEWEYAARAGTTGDYYGNVDSIGWYRENSGGKTHPVGQKEANDFGLYDMSGNVWEWCADWYDEDYYAKSPGVDPTGATSGSVRVIRGGGWYYDAVGLRSAVRNRYSPSFRYSFLGFRVVRN